MSSSAVSCSTACWSSRFTRDGNPLLSLTVVRFRRTRHVPNVPARLASWERAATGWSGNFKQTGLSGVRPWRSARDGRTDPESRCEGQCPAPVNGGGNVFRANRIGGREGRHPVAAAVDGAAANAGPCQQDGVAPGPVIAAVGTEAGYVRDPRRPAELAHPHHQRLVQEPAHLQVFQERR